MNPDTSARASQVDPRTNENDAFKAAHRLQVNGETELAIAAYRAILANNPGHVLALYNLGVALEAQGLDEEAFNHYQTASRLDPGYARAQNNIGALMVKQGRLAEAAAIFVQATDTDPAYGEAWANLCHARTQLNKFDLAIHAGEMATRHAPTLFRAHNNLGIALMKAGRPARAEQAFSAAIRLQPDSAIALGNLATSLEKQFRYDDAVPYYEQALTADPNYIRARCNFAWTQLCRGEFDASIRLSTQVLASLAAEGQILPNVAPEPPNILRKPVSREALFLFDEVCQHYGVTYFLVFGTLLGCLRNGDFISYDTDIDLGYWDGENMGVVLDNLPEDFAVQKKPLPNGSVIVEEILKHRINIAISYQGKVFLDLYKHFEKDNHILSGFELGENPLLYHVSPFGLAETRFLERPFLIPDTRETYLEECYGDWKTPDPNFETSLCAANLVGGFPEIARALAYYRTAQRCFQKDYARGLVLLERLIEKDNRSMELRQILSQFRSRLTA